MANPGSGGRLQEQHLKATTEKETSRCIKNRFDGKGCPDDEGIKKLVLKLIEGRE